MPVKIERNQVIFVTEQSHQRLPGLQHAVRSMDQEQRRSSLVPLIAIMDFSAMTIVEKTRRFV